MTEAELERVESILKVKRAELSASLCNWDEIATEKAQVAPGEVPVAAQREIARGNLDRETHMLRQIRDALALISQFKHGGRGLSIH